MARPERKVSVKLKGAVSAFEKPRDMSQVVVQRVEVDTASVSVAQRYAASWFDGPMQLRLLC